MQKFKSIIDGKPIRATYPLEFSIGLLCLIFFLSTFLSFEIFNASWHTIIEGEGPIFGMVLSGMAIVIMALILWEEFLFPVRIKPLKNEIVFRNHFTKLKTQIAIYCAIPIIVLFIYFNYEVSPLAYFIWATICISAPVMGKLMSGIKNYNDFLKLTNETIEYKNNEKAGVLALKDIQEIIIIRDEVNTLHKIQVLMSNNRQVTIDLDEMELEAYLHTVENFIISHYRVVVK
jgi:hypothetical protein